MGFKTYATVPVESQDGALIEDHHLADFLCCIRNDEDVAQARKLIAQAGMRMHDLFQVEIFCRVPKGAPELLRAHGNESGIRIDCHFGNLWSKSSAELGVWADPKSHGAIGRLGGQGIGSHLKQTSPRRLDAHTVKPLRADVIELWQRRMDRHGKYRGSRQATINVGDAPVTSR